MMITLSSQDIQIHERLVCNGESISSTTETDLTNEGDLLHNRFEIPAVKKLGHIHV